MGYCYFNVRVNSANDSCILYDNFVKFGPVTPELTELICERLVRHSQKTGVFGRISPALLDQFSQSLHQTDDGFIPYFPICQGTLPWQPNNIAKMLSMLTDMTCIRCTSARKRTAISWSSCAYWQRKWCLYSLSRENLMKFGPVTHRVDRDHLWTSGMTRPKNWRISSNISKYTGPIFTILSPYESALCGDDGFVHIF